MWRKNNIGTVVSLWTASRSFCKKTAWNWPETWKPLFTVKIVLYAQRLFGGSAQAIEYQGCYTHKIAISNSRLTGIDLEKVSFSYRDYSDGGNTKIMTLDSVEFLPAYFSARLPQDTAFRNTCFPQPKLKTQQQKMKPTPTERERPVYQKASSFCAEIKPSPCCKAGHMAVVMFFLPNTPPLRQPKPLIVSPPSTH